MTASPTVIEFAMSGQKFRFDADHALVTGDEALLVEQIAGVDFIRWATQMGAGDLSTRDLLLLAYLATRRGNEHVEWLPFIKTVSPYTIDNVRVVQAENPTPDPAGRRTAASPAATST